MMQQVMRHIERGLFALGLAAAVGCGSGASDAPGAQLFETIETYTLTLNDDGTHGGYTTYEQVPVSGIGEARQGLLACNWADNETFYLAKDAIPADIDVGVWDAQVQFNTIANTTGVVATPWVSGGHNPDAWIRLTTATSASPACTDSDPNTGCTGAWAVCAVKDGKRSQCEIYLHHHNLRHVYGSGTLLNRGVRAAVLHELGHTQGLKHFTSGTSCSDPVGTGATCAWGSKPGGADTVMSYCASILSVQNYDGCELEELYWNIGNGAEKNGGSTLSCPN